jgi:cephalosporin hydroxylase
MGPVNGEVYDKTPNRDGSSGMADEPNRAIELYKRGEPTFEVDATSKEDLDRFQSVLSQFLILSC